MIRAFYAAGAGMQAQQLNMDVSSNNMSNIQTTGFKKSRASFQDLTYAALKAPDGQKAGVQLGSGSRVGSINRSFLQGAPVYTGNPTDLAVEGQGFFAVDNGTGEIHYTRDGSFKLSAEQDGTYLVNDNGDYLLNSNGDRISLPYGTESLTVDRFGRISAPGLPDIFINLVTFPNPEGLEAIGANRYRQTPASGAPIPDAAGSILQNYLESSNVDLLEEMTALIRTQRVFQLNSRVVQAADEMESTANNLRT
jgi:flagellar basal-body rod protein FlgG